MLPSPAHPERGTFVRDQVSALRRLDGLDIELYEFPPGGRALARAGRDLRRRFATRGSGARGTERFDVVHAHYGLTAWPSLAVPAPVHALTVHGNDMRHPRTRMITGAALSRIDLLAAVSSSLAQELPGRKARARAQVLPCGVDLVRFRSIPRSQARAELGLDLDLDRPYLLFAADPARAIKRYDLALTLARAVGVELLVLGGVDPASAPLWFNAVNAVLMPSGHEGFGLAVLEALACDVPVLTTPVGIHPEALAHVAGTLCAPFDLARWAAALRPHLQAADPRIDGRTSAMRYSDRIMAERVADAWRSALARVS
jgi:glycosyltransferase involved in cell wall biosynthesis